MAKKKPKSYKRAKARIQKAATKKPVIRLTKKELARVQKAHARPEVTAKPVMNGIVIMAGEKALIQKGWVWFTTGRNANGRKYKLGSKPLAKIIKEYESNPPTTPDEAAARRLGRD